MLHMGDLDRSKLIGNTIVKMVGAQPDLDNDTLTYYNRFDDSFNLLKSFDPDDKGTAVRTTFRTPICDWPQA